LLYTTAELAGWPHPESDAGVRGGGVARAAVAAVGRS